MSERKQPLNGAVKLKCNHKNYNCPVSVHFKLKTFCGNLTDGRYVRMHNLVMQHNHPLVIDDRKVLLRQDILDEIKMYL